MFITEKNRVRRSGNAIYNPVEGRWERPLTYDSQGNIKVATFKSPPSLMPEQLRDRMATPFHFPDWNQQANQLREQGEKLFVNVKAAMEASMKEGFLDEDRDLPST